MVMRMFLILQRAVCDVGRGMKRDMGRDARGIDRVDVKNKYTPAESCL